MKFNWGTGILIFLVLFLAASAAFIIFAMNQDVNLVHKDYYEKGVDYTQEMNTMSRSEKFTDSVLVYFDEQKLLVDVRTSLAVAIDSGKVLMFRPSGSKYDIQFPLNIPVETISIAREKLIAGRYILKLSWYSAGLKYEIDKTVNVP